MKRTGLALALLFLAGGLLADPLFCCALPTEDSGVRFEAPPMDCCSEEGTGCPPRLERAANLPLAALVSNPPVLTAETAVVAPALVRPPAQTVSATHSAVERPPRLHLLHSLFRI